MKASRKPSPGTRTSVFSSFFCLSDASLSHQRNAADQEHFQEVFSKLLPFMNLVSTCYFISRESPTHFDGFESALQRVSAFLEENRFLQMSLRPVHPFSRNDADAWISAYLRYLRACKPFQEEGYREQIIARLRIFPVVFLKDAAAAAEAGPFLSLLQESFFLPSILVPHEAINDLDAISTTKGSPPPWVRVYVTDSSGFDPRRALEILHAHEIFDRLLEEDSSELPEANEILCRESLILDSSARVRSCLGATGIDVSAFPPDEGETDPSSALFLGRSGTRPSRCLDCLLQSMVQAGASYRLNPQGATAWHQLCDRLATQCVGRGSHDRAIRVWRSSAEAYPPEEIPSSLLLHTALCHYQTGNLEEAMKELTEARKRAPQSPDVRYYMGRCEFGWRDYIEAADRFSEAVDLGLSGPLRLEAHYYRGLSHYHLEEFEEALQALAEAERGGMAGTPLPFYQGLCLLGKQEPRTALPYFHEALSRGPSPEDLFHVLFYIAHTYKEIEDFDRALDYCEKADRVQPMNYECWNLKGFCHFKQCNHDEAIACFEKAVEIDPTSGIDYANIASNLRDKGDIEGAIRMYRKALSLDPTIEFARDNLRRLQSGRAE